VAYLTIANFIFLAAVLWIVLSSNTQHATAACHFPLSSLLEASA
jgi:hypothetical protein